MKANTPSITCVQIFGLKDAVDAKLKAKETVVPAVVATAPPITVSGGPTTVSGTPVTNTPPPSAIFVPELPEIVKPLPAVDVLKPKLPIAAVRAYLRCMLHELHAQDLLAIMWAVLLVETRRTLRCQASISQSLYECVLRSPQMCAALAHQMLAVLHALMLQVIQKQSTMAHAYIQDREVAVAMREVQPLTHISNAFNISHACHRLLPSMTNSSRQSMTS